MLSVTQIGKKVSSITFLWRKATRLTVKERTTKNLYQRLGEITLVVLSRVAEVARICPSVMSHYI
jgi:hypothetical protein